MERLALITIILPFVGAFIVGLNKKHFAQIATVFAALATLGTMLVAGQWFADGHQSVTYDIVAFEKTAIFGVTLDAVSTLIAFAVVALGFLICLYSCGYLTHIMGYHVFTRSCSFLSGPWRAWCIPQL